MQWRQGSVFFAINIFALITLKRKKVDTLEGNETV